MALDSATVAEPPMSPEDLLSARYRDGRVAAGSWNLSLATLLGHRMCVGYPDPAVPTGIKPRLPQRAVLHREQYSAEPQPAAFAEYDRHIRAFQREQRMSEIDWTRQTSNRVRDAAALHGRDRIRAALDLLGFALR